MNNDGTLPLRYRVQTDLEPAQTPIQGVTDSLAPGVKWSGREAD